MWSWGPPRARSGYPRVVVRWWCAEDALQLDVRRDGVRTCARRRVEVLAAIDVAMGHADLHAELLPQGPAERVGEDDRAVASAGATDGDRQVALSLALGPGEDELEEALGPRDEVASVLLREDEVDHLGVGAGE